MKKRLTVHLKNVPTIKVEVNTKKGIIKKNKTFNTLSFDNVKECDVSEILQNIQDNEKKIIVKHYLSNYKIKGHSKVKKKS